MSKNRYQTLDVSLNINNDTMPSISSSPLKRFSNTIDFNESPITKQDIRDSMTVDNQERVNKFRQLYYKNQKLRKQLKLLNVKLNQRLQKIKLQPSKRKKAQSVDLNVQKPTKALERELQNAYKQVTMYKKQISTLKVKEQSQSTYQKYKLLENEISYRDIEITRVESEITSLKNIKKIQDKTLVEDVQNQQMKQKLQQYQKQFKQGQQKLKQISLKARRRQQQYKKQQAYQVALQKKLRKGQQPQQDIPQSPVIQKQYTPNDFYLIREQIVKIKQQNQTLQKRLDLQKKQIRDSKSKTGQLQIKYKQKQIQLKSILLRLQSYSRLIKDNQKKTKIELELSNYKTQSVYDKQMADMELLSQQYSPKKSPFQLSQLSSINPKSRKFTFGSMSPSDHIYKFNGPLVSLRCYTDQTDTICGLGFAYMENNIQKDSGLIGLKGIQTKWGKIVSIQVITSQQGHISHLNINETGKIQGQSLKLEQNEYIAAVACSIRQDNKITELTFWIKQG